MSTLAKRTWKLQEFVGHGSAVTCAALGQKSGRVMATGGEDGKVNMWHIGSPNCIMTLSPLTSAVEAVHFNPSEEFVCAGSRSGALRIWNLAEAKVIRQLSGHKAAVRSVDFHSYGEFVTSGSDDHKVRMWDIRRKGCIFTYKGHVDRVNAVQFSPDGRWIGSVSDDKTCKLWDITAGKMLHELKDHSSAVNCITFHPRELLLATGSSDRTTRIYDVEQFKLVSCSPLEGNGIQKAMFSESGEHIYTASQDMFKSYSYDPICQHLDTVIVKWGKPADVTISMEKLMGCSFFQNIVSVHMVDLKTLKNSPSFESESIKFEEPSPAPAISDPRSHSNVTIRPHTTCGVATMAAKFQPIAPQAIHCNNNNNLETRQVNQDNKEEIFKPSSTLARSPTKETDFPPEPTKDLEIPTKPISTRENKAKSPTNQPKPLPSAQPVKQAPSQTVLPSTSINSSVNTAQPPGRDADPSGAAMEWCKAKQNIPEKPLASDPVVPGKLVVEPKPKVNDLPKKAASDLGLSTVIPSDRQDPIGLDMNAFLPVRKDNVAQVPATKTDMEAANLIRKGLSSMRMVLTNRHKNLEIVRALWTSGDVMTSINSAVKMDDQALIVDLLNVLTLKPTLWSLDLCLIMLPQIKSLINSKYETYITVGCCALKVILKNFSQVIRSNLKTPPSAVDLSREERHNKSKACFAHLTDIKDILHSKQHASGKTGSQFRELKILISTLE